MNRKPIKVEVANKSKSEEITLLIFKLVGLAIIVNILMFTLSSVFGFEKGGDVALWTSLGIVFVGWAYFSIKKQKREEKEYEDSLEKQMRVEMRIREKILKEIEAEKKQKN